MVLSFYSSYNGDFTVGEREARTALDLNPSSRPISPLAAGAALVWARCLRRLKPSTKMEKLDALGASLAASGLADIASHEGRYADAAEIHDHG